MVEIKDLTVCYGKKTIVENTDGIFGKNRITAVIGHNGCGKTTLLRAVAGLIPYKGNILLDGKNEKEYGRRTRAGKVAYMPQTRHTPEMTVETYLMCARYPYMGINKSPSQADRDAVELAMEQTGIENLRHRLVRKLSGGERQKVYLAFALSQGTDILLLDEPTTYMDIDRQYEMLELMQMTKKEKTVIAVLHDIAHALEFADDIAVMNGGKIEMMGDKNAVLNSGIIERIFNVSIRKICIDGTYMYHIIPKNAAREGDAT